MFLDQGFGVGGGAGEIREGFQAGDVAERDADVAEETAALGA